MSYHLPRVIRLTGSVGAFGTNNPDDVKTLQKMIINAGYNQIHGNFLRITGHCGPETNSAIIWYQRLLNMTPSGLLHPQAIWFFNMFSKSISPHWRPRDIGPLHVREGQITFDAEGLDYLSAVEPFRQPQHMRQFSRILHWTGGASGVTIGRGYDMKNRSHGQIIYEFRSAGIEEYKAVICSKASGLQGGNAFQFVKSYGQLVGEISHLQQVRLFEIVYRAKRNETINVYKRLSRHIANAPEWSALDPKVKDVVVDIFYQGVHNTMELFKAAINGTKALMKLIESDASYMLFENNRQRLKYLR
ncbi:peptidoglycan-binding protein [Pseudescherichia sp.]|uniref:peptidoglycan-binding protein n=1 Tax=Pseudescherichia sp. TaxID=2055881 RepID=UPI00289DA630|nr:peptidoglycan-binding protein [Pseudescherichia sp.]